MKPLPSQIYLLQIVLLVLAAFLVFLGLFYAAEDLMLWPATWGYIRHQGNELPVILGVINFAHLATFLGFLLLYLCFEFYGLKTGLYSVLALAVMMTTAYFLFEGLTWITQHTQKSYFDRNIISFFTLTKMDFASLLLAFTIGISVIFLLAAALKKLTQNYFMFFRYTIAALIGFAVFVAVEFFFRYFREYDLQTILLFTITPAIQFAILVLLSVVPLYLLRLVLGIFRGHAKEEATEKEKAGKCESEKIEKSKTKTWLALVVVPLLFGLATGVLAIVYKDQFGLYFQEYAPAFVKLRARDLFRQALATSGAVVLATFFINTVILLLSKLIRKKKHAAMYQSPSKETTGEAIQSADYADEDTHSDRFKPQSV